MLIRRIARPLLATTFIAQGVDGLRNTKELAAAAAPTLDKGIEALPDQVSQNVPDDTETLIRINAAFQIGGGALLATGKFPRIAALTLAGTLLPGQIGSNTFWNESDPERKTQQRKEFLTGVSLLGGLLITAVDTEGKPSLGWRGRRAANKASDAVAGALPIAASSNSATREHLASGLHTAAERGRELANVAAQRGSELADIARERGPELAEAARERGAAWAEVARERGSEFADVARERGPELADAARDHGGTFADLARERGGDIAQLAREKAADYRSR